MPERGRYPRRLLAHCWQPDPAVQKPVAVEAVKPVFSCDFNPWECHMLGSSPPPLVTHSKNRYGCVVCTAEKVPKGQGTSHPAHLGQAGEPEAPLCPQW